MHETHIDETGWFPASPGGGLPPGIAGDLCKAGILLHEQVHCEQEREYDEEDPDEQSLAEAEVEALNVEIDFLEWCYNLLEQWHDENGKMMKEFKAHIEETKNERDREKSAAEGTS